MNINVRLNKNFTTAFNKVQEAYGEELGETLRMKVGSKQDDIILATAQMALLAARLDRPEKYGLYQYLLENPAAESALNAL